MTFKLKKYPHCSTIRFDIPYLGDYLVNNPRVTKESYYCVAFAELFMRVEDLEDEIAELKQKIRELEKEGER